MFPFPFSFRQLAGIWLSGMTGWLRSFHCYRFEELLLFFLVPEKEAFISAMESNSRRRVLEQQKLAEDNFGRTWAMVGNMQLDEQEYVTEVTEVNLNPRCEEAIWRWRL